ncbi:MAG: hypothetical protein ACI9J2_001324 [Saprospiraceae bacterium]
MTAAGEAILAGKMDIFNQFSEGFWMGGVQITHANNWRWDEKEMKLTRVDL